MKTLLAIVLIAFCLPSFSQKESIINEAADFAQTFLKQRTGNKIELTLQYASDQSIGNSISVFSNRKGGYVILGNENNLMVPLAYSSNGFFPVDDSSSVFLEFIEIYKQASLKKKSCENQLKSAQTFTPVSPLLDAAGISLNQFYHAEVGNCPTGCVATAFAQIMAYHKYPASGTGSHCFTHPVYGELCADFENTVYNWDDPSNEDYELLSFHLGIAMDMNYCGHESGSVPSASDYKDVLAKNFKYYIDDGSTESYYIYNELYADRPVYISLPGDPGHALVVDGCDSEGYFHLNFGWGGSYNGYFLLNSNTTFTVAYTFGTNISDVRFISPKPFEINEQDSLALLAFHNSMDGTTGWDINQPVSQWTGVLIMNEHVVELNFPGYKLNGKIPDEIGDLSYLRRLNIGGHIGGYLPPSICNLSNLLELSIRGYYNGGTSELPDNIGNLSQLEILEMPNLLEEEIPSSIGQLTQLKYIDFSNGKMTGDLPSSFYELNKLETIKFINCGLSGTIEPGIGNMRNLEQLELANNAFSGSLPKEIGRLKELTELYISGNQFSGSLTDSIGNCSKLHDIYLSDNAFEGKVPNSLTNFSTIKMLNLSNNKFTALPDSIGKMTLLREIVVDHNELETLPEGLSQLTDLYRLNVGYNKIKTIPELGEMPSLWDINLSHNELEQLPDNFGDLAKAYELYLSHNQLTELPASFEKLSRLRELYMDCNKLTKFPFSFSFLSSLETLSIDSNQLASPMPQLGHLDLQWISVKYNNLVFSDIKASGLPDDRDYVDDYVFSYYYQNTLELSDTVFESLVGDSIGIDIRSISRLSDSRNVYKWYKNGTEVAEGPVLSFTEFNESDEGSYVCKIKNTGYQKLLEIETSPMQLKVQEDKPLVTEGAFFSTKESGITTYTDNYISLIPPPKIRGDITWMFSSDSLNWLAISDSMEQKNENIKQINGDNLLLEPINAGYYRFQCKENNCDPLLSDVVKIESYGDLVLDTVLNVMNESVTIEADSIELILPKGLSDKNFRVTIKKLYNPPEAIDGIKMSSVYDVTIENQSSFDVPLYIKLKNLDLQGISDTLIERYKPVYYDEKAQQWKIFEKGGISYTDSAIVFYSNHLTKLAWFELAHGSFTHIHTTKRANIVYKYGVGNEDAFYGLYAQDCSPQLWHTSNTDPDKGGTPYMIQDAGELMDQIIIKFESLGLSVPSLRFNVYIGGFDGGVAGQIGATGYLAGRGYFYVNPVYNLSIDILRHTLAHEYMHYTQDYYMTVFLDNKFWMEATAPLSDRMVWESYSVLKIAEPELTFSRALIPTSNKTIFELIALPWDYEDGLPVVENIAFGYYGKSADANLSSTFLHYLRSFRDEPKLNVPKLLKETPTLQSWKNYLNYYISTYMSSTIGDEFEAFVKYIFEGSNPKFSVLNKNAGQDPLKYIRMADQSFLTQKYYKFKDQKIIKDTIQYNVPYLSAKMVQLYNMNVDKQKAMVKYKMKSSNEKVKTYICRYNTDGNKMDFEEITGIDSAYFLINPSNGEYIKRKENLAYLLFINTDKDENYEVNYELEVFPVPDITFWHSIHFYLGYSLAEAKIHTFTNGTTQTVGEWLTMPGVFKQFPEHWSPLTINVLCDEETINIYATSDHTMQNIVYNYVTGDMDIEQWEKWMELDNPKSKIDIRETTMKLKNVRLIPYENPVEANFYFKTANTTETQAVIEEMTYKRRLALWNEKEGKHDPTVTTTYVSTDYSSDQVKLLITFY